MDVDPNFPLQIATAQYFAICVLGKSIELLQLCRWTSDVRLTDFTSRFAVFEARETPDEDDKVRHVSAS